MSHGAVLSKSRQVLEVATVHSLGVTYRGTETGHRTVITMKHRDYRELGNPEEITVTIEPGNKIQEQAEEEGWDDVA